jgi:hypothetical protein
MGLSAQDGVGGARGAGRLRFRFQLVLHGLRIQRAAQRASAACAGAGAGSGAAGHRPLPPAVRPSNPLGEPTPKNGHGLGHYSCLPCARTGCCLRERAGSSPQADTEYRWLLPHARTSRLPCPPSLGPHAGRSPAVPHGCVSRRGGSGAGGLCLHSAAAAGAQRERNRCHAGATARAARIG